MDFANKGNRSTKQAATQATAPVAAAAQQFKAPTASTTGRGDGTHQASSIFILIASALLILTLVLALIFIKNDGRRSESSLIQADRYQAIFLDSQDGQVYFGKLAVYNEDTYVLKDIYYVRVENPIQPDGGQGQQANISLAKLGSELHAPEDYMYIQKSQVLYWENLQDEGQVVSAIEDYKANGSQTQQQTNDAASGTQPAGTPQQNDTPGTPVETPTEDTTTPATNDETTTTP